MKPKRTNWVVLVFTMLLLILGSALMLILMIDYVNNKYTIDKLEEQVEMQSLYYELKMDYYEELHGVDLDDTPEDFEKFLYDNYPELYDYVGLGK
ncbi:MAG: hypothetical protein EOM11_08105 [Erysipelotrichia bacterium]|nr:hypothetical protein [Erysipelotrichia bacterium]